MFNDLVNEIVRGSADSTWQANNAIGRELASRLEPTPSLHEGPRDRRATRAHCCANDSDQITRRVHAEQSACGEAHVERETLYVPHATQCLGTFLLVGLAANDDLENHMVRCLTGEGKSICLALTSTLFAMLGYTVNVTCYSKLLSERGRRSFRELFRAMKVEERITYSTLGGLIEKLVQPGGAMPISAKETHISSGVTLFP